MASYCSTFDDRFWNPIKCNLDLLYGWGKERAHIFQDLPRWIVSSGESLLDRVLPPVNENENVKRNHMTLWERATGLIAESYNRSALHMGLYYTIARHEASEKYARIKTTGVMSWVGTEASKAKDYFADMAKWVWEGNQCEWRSEERALRLRLLKGAVEWSVPVPPFFCKAQSSAPQTTMPPVTTTSSTAPTAKAPSESDKCTARGADEKEEDSIQQAAEGEEDCVLEEVSETSLKDAAQKNNDRKEAAA